MVRRPIPLEIVEITKNKTSIVIGELTSSKEHAIDDVMKLSLGVGKLPATSKLEPALVEKKVRVSQHNP